MGLQRAPAVGAQRNKWVTRLPRDPAEADDWVELEAAPTTTPRPCPWSRNVATLTMPERNIAPHDVEVAWMRADGKVALRLKKRYASHKTSLDGYASFERVVVVVEKSAAACGSDCL